MFSCMNCELQVDSIAGTPWHSNVRTQALNPLNKHTTKKKKNYRQSCHRYEKTENYLC